VAATLAQIIAVEEARRSATDRWWKLVAQDLAKDQLLVGHDYVHEAFEGGRQEPPDKQKVRLNTEALLAEAQEKLGQFFDASATRDWANTGARADVVLDGETILPDVPTTFLLFLERRLTELLADIRKMPTQNPAQDWHPSTTPGIWRTEPVKRATTRKDVEFRTVSPAEGMRPAQYEAVPYDVPSGEWTRVELTSAMTARQSAAIQANLTRLAEAVKMARIHANRVEAPDVHVGRAIFDRIFRGVFDGSGGTTGGKR
jgi:hypothetical protein